jgi:hypothetical protein
MQQENIKCKDCQKRCIELEDGDVFVVVECKPLPDQNGVAEEAKICRIVWRLKDGWNLP